ncbi:MAG: hypothetical protein PHX43_02620 [Alphaproteobacteria bacterium]|nr:hypothetical protein [Alphaproteobacteria bacterium]
MLSRLKSTILRMRSENWGGLAGLVGDIVLIAGGDAQSLAATALFLCAEGVRARWGHKTAGYSASCLLTGIGGTSICYSAATSGNTALQISIFVIVALLILGTLRYPIELIAEKLRSAKMKRVADLIQPITGSLMLIQRVPVLISSAIGGNIVIFVATFFWGLSDALMGRLHQFMKDILIIINRRKLQ